jgi:hypothetical protein
MFHWLNYDEWSKDRVFFSEKQRRFESIWPSWGFLTTQHMLVKVRTQVQTRTYIYQPSLRSSKMWTGPALPESTVHHLPAPLLVDSQDGYTILSPSPHSQCAVIVSHNGIAKVLGLPEYVASTAKSRTQQAYNERSLTDIGGHTTLRLHSQCKSVVAKPPAQSWFKFMIIIKP